MKMTIARQLLAGMSKASRRSSNEYGGGQVAGWGLGTYSEKIHGVGGGFDLVYSILKLVTGSRNGQVGFYLLCTYTVFLWYKN